MMSITDLLKKQFSPKKFHDPFTDGSDILKKIERRFVVKQDAMYHLKNWVENIKNKIFIQSISTDAFPALLNGLKEYQTYWFVGSGSAPTDKQHVYSCSPKAIQALASITQDNFFIVDKRLDWFTYFQWDKSNCKISIYKSGEAKTPFDFAS